VRRRALPGAAALVAAALLAPAARAGVAVEGVQRAVLAPPAAARVADYRNDGYRLRLLADRAVVEVAAAPLGSAVPFTPPMAAAGDAVGQLARAVAAGASTRYEATSRVLGWVSRNVRYDLDRRAAQDPAAVLARRSSYCTGVARLTVALLAALDIPAREVPGWVGEPGRAGYHRWIEVHYPDRGWVFSDPLRSHHYVPASYLRLASDRLSGQGDGLLLELADGLAPVDVYAAGAAAVTARRNSARRLAAALEVAVAGAPAGEAVLEGGGWRRVLELRRGGGAFVGLAPGSYHLRLRLAGGADLERRVEVAGAARTALHLVAATQRPGGESR
jgi:hypothetical protein